MAIVFEEEQRRLADLRAADLGETELTISPLVHGFRFTWSNVRPLLRIGWPLLLAMLAAPHVAPVFGKLGGGLFTNAVGIVAASIFAVAIHRWIVFEAPPPPNLYFYLRFRPVELKYAILTLIWGAVLVAVMFLQLLPPILAALLTGSGALTAAASIAGALFIAWFITRSSLVFPHLAVTGRFDWRLAWRAMKGKFWVAYMTWFLPGLVYALIVYIVDWYFRTLGLIAGEEQAPWIVILLKDSILIALSAFFGTMSLAVLSFIYRDVVQAEQVRRAPPRDPDPAPEKPIVVDSKDWTG